MKTKFLQRVLWLLMPLLMLFSTNVWGTDYELVTSTAGLEVGANYVIGTGTSGSVKFMSTTSQSNYRPVTSNVTVSNNKVTATNTMLVLTLGGSTGQWTFATVNYGGTAGNLNAGSTTSNNYLYVNTSNDNYKKWTISFSSNAAVITCAGKSSRNVMRFNSDRITCYTSGQSAIYLFKEVSSGSNPAITTSETSLSDVGYSTTDFSQQVKSFKVSGSNLKADVTVTAPTNYEVCKTADGTYAASVSFSKGSGTLSASDVYVRLKSGKTAGNYSGDISCTSTDATEKTVGLSGSVPFKVTWKANGTTHATTYVAYATSPGTALGTLPSDPDPEDYTCDEKAFYGWYDGDTYDNPSVAPTLVSTSDKIITDKTYNAVFATATGSGGTSTLVASAQGWGNGDEATQKTISTVTYTWAKNNGTNKPAYYDSGYAVRLYQETNGTNGNQVTISSSNTITGIVFTYVDGYAFLTNAPSVGTLTAAGVWSGSATSIVFKNKNNAQVRIQSIVVTYGTLSYSNYSTTCQACVQPTSVAITGTNKYLGGQTINLTAAPQGGTGTPTYQWQKKISGNWTNLENGNGISGATAANLQISSCTHANSGGYRCIVSTGEGCSTKSHADGTDGYGVHVFSIHGKYTSDENYTDTEIIWTSGTTGTATITMEAKKTYLFKVWSNNGYYYGHGANTNEDFMFQPTTWDCGINNNEMRLFTTVAGNYTFTVNIEHGLDGSPYVNVQVGYPSMSHPNSGYVYVQKFSWRPYLHYWYDNSHLLSAWGSDPQLNSDQYTNICGTDYWCVPVIDYYCNFIAKDAAGDPSSNTTGDQHTNSPHPGQKLYNDGSWKWGDFSTYTISYAGGGGSGSMSSHSDLCPGSSQQITSNTFTKTDYIFTGWHANVDVKINGNIVPVGNLITDAATIQDIQSDITLTAQWVHIPVITLSESVRQFGDRKVGGGPYTMTFTVTGQYLTEDVTLALGNNASGQFSIDKTSLSPVEGSINAEVITITYSPTTAGSHAGPYINVTSTGATMRSVTLFGTGKWGVAWSVNGIAQEETLVANNEKPTFPSTPSSCDATSTTFIGWTKTPWTGKQPQSYIDGLTGDDVVHTSNSTMSNVTANGTEYHAVFAKVTGGSNTISIDGTGLQEVVSSITSGYESKDFNVGGYTFSASAVTKSTNGSTSGWFQLKKNNDYISIPSLPGKITNISSATIRAAGGGAVSTGVYFNTSATTSSPVASQSLSSANSFSLNVTGNHTSGYILFGAATCINQLSVTYSTGSSSDYLTTCCDNMVEAPEVGATSTKNSITLSWTNVTGADGYTVTCSGGSVGEVTSSGSNRSCQITSLEANTNYTWSVLATYDSPYCGATPANGNTTTSPVYTVSYNTNGGSVSPIPATSNYAAGETVNVANKPSTTTKGGYDFTGWNTAPNGLGTHYAADGTASFTMPSNAVVLYAEWTAKVDHFFDDMHQTTGYTSGGHIESGNYTMPGPLSNVASGNACETSHYIFVGWVISGGQNPDGTINGSPKIWRAGESNNASGATYYAVWAEE